MCFLTYSVYIIILLIVGLALLWQVLSEMIKQNKRGCFDSIQIFDPLYPTNGVYNFNEIEPIILKSAI